MDYTARSPSSSRSAPPAFVITVPHATADVPAWLPPAALGDAARTHHAYDIGARELARDLAARLGATVIEGDVGRLIIDLNRALGPGAIPATAGLFGVVACNRDLADGDLAARVTLHRRFHRRIRAILDQHRDRDVVLIDQHTFTRAPDAGPRRTVDIGVCVGADRDLALALTTALTRCAREHGVGVDDGGGLRRPVVRRDEPYSGTHPGAFIGRAYAVIPVRTMTLEVCDDLVTTAAATSRVAALLANGIQQVATLGDDDLRAVART